MKFNYNSIIPTFFKSYQNLGLTLVCLLIFGSATAQIENQVIYNLVLEGGGAKGMAYPGAFMELEKMHVLDSVKRLAGTSSGSIHATLYAVGYSPKEMYHISYKTNFNHFNQKGFPIIRPVFRMKNTFGWYSSERFVHTVEDAIAFKTGNKDLTFQQLHDSAKRSDKYKDLYITGTCINEQRTIIFSHETYPDMRIADAVRISASLPFHFETIYMTPQGAIINHKKQNDSTLMMVDGGLLMNYPIHVFDTMLNYGTCIEYLPNPNTLGMRLDDLGQSFIEKENKSKSELDIKGFNGYMQAFYAMSFEKLNLINLSADDWDRTISIDSKGITTKEPKLTHDEKEMLVESGRSAVRSYYNIASTTK